MKEREEEDEAVRRLEMCWERRNLWQIMAERNVDVGACNDDLLQPTRFKLDARNWPMKA